MHIGHGQPLGNPIRTSSNGPSPLPAFRQYIAAALANNHIGMRRVLVEAARAGFRIDYNQAHKTPMGVDLMRALRKVDPDRWTCRDHRTCMFNPKCHASILLEALDAADAARASRIFKHSRPLRPHVRSANIAG